MTALGSVAQKGFSTGQLPKGACSICIALLTVTRSSKAQDRGNFKPLSQSESRGLEHALVKNFPTPTPNSVGGEDPSRRLTVSDAATANMEAPSGETVVWWAGTGKGP
jgi:hypothetical protein